MNTKFELVSVEGLTFTQERLKKIQKTLKPDMHLVADDKKVVTVHRFVLAMYSPVFAKEFRFMEPNGATVHPVMNCASSSLEQMVDLFYKGEAKVPNHKADDFKALLSFLQVKDVKETVMEDKKALKKSAPKVSAAPKASAAPKVSAAKKQQSKQGVKRAGSDLAGNDEAAKKKNAAIGESVAKQNCSVGKDLDNSTDANFAGEDHKEEHMEIDGSPNLVDVTDTDYDGGVNDK